MIDFLIGFLFFAVVVVVLVVGAYQIGKLANADQTPKPAALPLVSQWTELDRQNLHRFLSSSSGVKLLNRLRAVELHNAVMGAKDVLHTSHSAGLTVGYGDAIKQVISLAHTSDKPEGEQKLDVVNEDGPPISVDDLIERGAG